jgi:hypothetical protein
LERYPKESNIIKKSTSVNDNFEARPQEGTNIKKVRTGKDNTVEVIVYHSSTRRLRREIKRTGSGRPIRRSLEVGMGHQGRGRQLEYQRETRSG